MHLACHLALPGTFPFSTFKFNAIAAVVVSSSSPSVSASASYGASVAIGAISCAAHRFQAGKKSDYFSFFVFKICISHKLATSFILHFAFKTNATFERKIKKCSVFIFSFSFLSLHSNKVHMLADDESTRILSIW